MEILLNARNSFDPNCVNKFGNTPLMEAALAYGQNESKLVSILNLHAKLGNSRFSLQKTLSHTNAMNKNFLNILAIRNFSGILSNILVTSSTETRNEYLSRVDNNGWNLFIEAVFNSSYNVVKFMIDENYVKEEWVRFESKNYGSLIKMAEKCMEERKPNSKVLLILIRELFKKYNIEEKLYK